MSTERDPIRPRTDAERRAYEAGYANAICDVMDQGIDKAREWLRLMVDTEEQMERAKR